MAQYSLCAQLWWVTRWLAMGYTHHALATMARGIVKARWQEVLVQSPQNTLALWLMGHDQGTLIFGTSTKTLRVMGHKRPRSIRWKDSTPANCQDKGNGWFAMTKGLLPVLYSAISSPIQTGLFRPSLDCGQLIYIAVISITLALFWIRLNSINSQQKLFCVWGQFDWHLRHNDVINCAIL